MPLLKNPLWSVLTLSILFFFQCKNDTSEPPSEEVIEINNSSADLVKLDALSASIKKYKNIRYSDSVDILYQQKANFHKNQNDLAKWLDSYWYWQDYYWDFPDIALFYLEEGIKNQWRLPNDTTEWEALLWMYLNKGYHLFTVGQVVAAIEAYDQAEKLHVKYVPNLKRPIDRIYKPLGAYLTMLGDNERARYFYEKALTNAPEVDTIGILAGLYNNIGLTYWNEGKNSNAIEEYLKGLRLEQQGYQIPWRYLAMLNSNLANSYLENGDSLLAQEYSLKALQQMRPLKDATDPKHNGMISSTYHTIGDILQQLKHPTDVEPLFNLALEYATKANNNSLNRQTAKIYLSLGQYYLIKNETEKAIHFFNQSLESVIPSFKPQEPIDHPLASDFHEENSIFEALEGKADALELWYEDRKDLPLLEAALECHELALKAEDKLWNVLQHESSKLWFQSDRRRRVDKTVRIAHRLFQITEKGQYLKMAFLAVEHSKGKLLQEAIQENLAHQEFQNQDTLFTRISKTKQILAFYEKEYQLTQDSAQKTKWLFQKNSINEELADLLDQLNNKYPNLYKIASNPQQNFRDLTQKEDSNGIIIEYFVGESNIYVFKIAGNIETPQLFILEKNQEKIQLAKTFINSLKKRAIIENNGEAYFQNAYAIFKWLFEPLDIANGESVTIPITIIPDGFISYLPFEAFVQQPEKVNWQQASFLLKEYEINYAYSLATHNFLNASAESASKRMIILAPLFSNRERGLTPLNQSKNLIQELGFIKPVVLKGRKAKLEQFIKKAPEFKLIHLSTHAQGDTTNGIPKIEFIDGSLYLPELYALNLNADLVTLGACETGLGRIETGEGVMSLARGFTYAGAKSLVASLWAVNERSTNMVFKGFYQKISRGIPKSSAMRAAKIDYLEDQSIINPQKSPYYWASFVYFGQNKSVVLE